MERKGIKLSEDSEEIYTYFLDYMYFETMNVLKNVKKKKSK